MVEFAALEPKGGSQHIALAALARSFGMSVRSCQRRLKEVGTTHSELIDSARFELAFRLLAENNCSVTEITLKLGYSYPGHFTRFFKQKVGLSPSEYRRIEVNG
ncbi:MAG: helix-turn-helix transcriptional regulator [Sedimentitalea sp.]|uniref:helix-turn-helix domain-containing protein n=1 Tax=Sedimentitalea sp. TaxID=2048915 RepID=UPI003296D007